MTFLKDITKKVSDSAKVAAKKSSNMVEATKLNFKINSDEEKIQKAYEEIGKRVFESYEKGEDIEEGFKEICIEIVAYKSNIQSLRDRILFLKNIKICPNCNFQLECMDAYCTKCGAKQEIPNFDEEEEKDETVEINEEAEKGEAAEINEVSKKDEAAEINKEAENKEVAKKDDELEKDTIDKEI